MHDLQFPAFATKVAVVNQDFGNSVTRLRLLWKCTRKMVAVQPLPTLALSKKFKSSTLNQKRDTFVLGQGQLNKDKRYFEDGRKTIMTFKEQITAKTMSDWAYHKRALPDLEIRTMACPISLSGIGWSVTSTYEYAIITLRF